MCWITLAVGVCGRLRENGGCVAVGRFTSASDLSAEGLAKPFAAYLSLSNTHIRERSPSTPSTTTTSTASPTMQQTVPPTTGRFPVSARQEPIYSSSYMAATYPHMQGGQSVQGGSDARGKHFIVPWDCLWKWNTRADDSGWCTNPRIGFDWVRWSANIIYCGRERC